MFVKQNPENQVDTLYFVSHVKHLLQVEVFGVYMIHLFYKLINCQLCIDMWLILTINFLLLIIMSSLLVKATF